MKRITLVAVLAAVMGLTIGVSTVAYAAGRVRPLGTEACSVTPNPVSNGEQYYVNGTGFRSGQVLNLRIEGTTLLTAAAADGTFSRWGWAQFLTAGTKEVKVYQAGDRRMTVLASCTFYANGNIQ